MEIDKSRKIVSIFNKQIQEFITQSVDTFPHFKTQPEITKLQNSLETTISLTPNVPIQLFYQNVIKKYKKQIDESDENFFLKCDDVSNESIDLLKKIYRSTSENNRKIIWDYVHRLQMLSIKYHTLKNS